MTNIASGLAVVGLLWGASAVRAADDFERAPIHYSRAEPDNAISQLQARLDRGEAQLEFDEELGYLPAVLQELNVSPKSQMLVFSKTSLQRHRISPDTPRALYFSDDMYVGYCRYGDVVEISAVDARLGTVFYTLDQQPAEKPRFRRQTDNCLLCHASSRNQGVPGHLVRSVFADARGMPILSAGTHRVDQETPLKDRWGGWYVTGKHGTQTHLGNLVIRERDVPEPVDNAQGHNVVDLSDRFHVDAYLTPHSDIVALLVLEHQTSAHNLLTRANFEMRQALHYETQLNRELGEPPDHRWNSTTVRMKSAGDALVKYLLFSGEAPLTAAVRGTSGFAEDFAQRGPRDSQGRSLRDFDLQTRLFKYPCSYLIYSPSFDALPDEMREYVLQQIWNVLTGHDQSPDFAHLTPADRTAILEILRATKPNLPEYWDARKPG